MTFMRKLDSPTKNFLYFFYRILKPLFDPVKFFLGIYGYLWYIRDYVKFSNLSERKLKLGNLFPILDEKTSLTQFDAHYYYQQIWVFSNVLKRKPTEHIDIASSYELSGYLSTVVKSKFVDLRPIEATLQNLEIVKGDILNLPFEDSSLQSVSCLHVIEHVGLGRYGDPIDPKGLIKACKELSRVLAKNGYLYLSTPVGLEAIYFNAHRVTPPEKIQAYFPDLKLESFSIVDDNNNFVQNVSPAEYKKSNYGCGMYIFRK